MNCRFCNTPLIHPFIDLVNAPPSNAFLDEASLNQPEVFFPLKLFVCHECFLVQIDEYKKSEDIFDQDYIYFSSFSKTWLKHAEDYAEMITRRLGLDSGTLVIEIASNDGYLLQNFVKKNIPCIGIEPTKNTAEVSKKKNIPTIESFFGEELAKHLQAEGKSADLIIGNNVLAHVPNINDFVRGLKTLLKPDGVITLEFPHLMRLIEGSQFDTIYHEHFSYFTFHTVEKIFKAHGLTIVDVDELDTHGGSLRIYAGHSEQNCKPTISAISLAKTELDLGMKNIEYYKHFQEKADRIKYETLMFLIKQKGMGKKVAAYGAAAKGNTLLNYCGIKTDLIQFVVDASPHKQHKYLPGSHIPVVPERELKTEKPDFVLIFPWNIKEEIAKQLEYIKAWQGQFVIAIPRLKCW